MTAARIGRAISIVGFVFATLPARSDAALSMVTSRPALGGTDFVDWAVLGGDSTVVNDPFNVPSNLGAVNLTVSNPTGDFERRDQPGGWSGNFSPGDALLWTMGTVGPMVIEFDVPVAAAGAQIQRNFFGGFVARVEAFGTSNNSLGFFTLAGNSTFSNDGSAIFLGVSDTSATIKRIEYSVDNTSQDFAINRLDILPGAQATPAPVTSLGTLAVAALLMSFLGWKKLRSAGRIGQSV